MKRARRRLPVPQHEFGFAPDAFALFSDSGLDGERMARERAEADAARRLADSLQPELAIRHTQTTPVHE